MAVYPGSADLSPFNMAVGSFPSVFSMVHANSFSYTIGATLSGSLAAAFPSTVSNTSMSVISPVWVSLWQVSPIFASRISSMTVASLLPSSCSA